MKPIALSPASEAIECPTATSAIGILSRRSTGKEFGRQTSLVLMLLLAGFIGLQALLPLGKVKLDVRVQRAGD